MITDRRINFYSSKTHFQTARNLIHWLGFLLPCTALHVSCIHECDATSLLLSAQAKSVSHPGLCDFSLSDALVTSIFIFYFFYKGYTHTLIAYIYSF